MSIDSALIVRRDAVPGTAELAAAVKELTGVDVALHPSFDLIRWDGGWVPVTVDGEESGFEYYPSPIADEPELPAEAGEHGDHALFFVGRGALSAETASLLQRVLAARWGAVGLIDGEIIPAEEMARESTPSPDLDPDLAATITGSPAERAAAMERYVAKFYPPTEPPKRDRFREWLRRDHTPEIIGVVLGALLLIFLIVTG